MSKRFQGFTDNVRQRANDLAQAAERITTDFAHDGERDMEQIIETATTETGRNRAARTGGSPGRIESGLMVNMVSSETSQEGTPFSANGATFEGTFGWTKGAEEYFEYQEDGTATIAPMHALLNAGIANRERARDEFDKAVRGK